jgi:outer membrane lipoprotein-sorting protein
MPLTPLPPARRQALRGLLAAAAVPCLAGMPARAWANRDPQALLVASDAVRNPGRPFRVTATLAEFERGKQVDESVLATFSRTLDESGQFASLIQFVEPARDAGKLLLKTGSDMWFYDPSTKASVRIAPQQRLMGQAANGDVVTVNFARDYKVQQAAEESVTDGERRKRDSLKLTLAASVPDATYTGIELWVDAETAAPIRARFLAESGRLLKTAFFRRFQRQLGADRPTETVIIDGVNTQAVTVVRLADYQARNLPASWFQRDYLPRFQGE